MRRLWMRLALPLIGAAFSAVLGFAPAFTQAAFAWGSNPSDGYMYSSGGSNSCDGYMYGSPCMGYQLPYGDHSYQSPAQSKQYSYHSYQPPAQSKQYSYHSYPPHKSYDQDDHSYNSHAHGYGGYSSSGSQMGGYGGYGSSGSQMGGYGGYGSSGSQMGGYGSGSSGYGSSGSQSGGYGGYGGSMPPPAGGYSSPAPQGGNPYGYPANPPMVMPPPMSNAQPPAAPPSSQAPVPAPGAQSATVNLVAHNLAFNMSTVTAPAGATVVVNFDNQDAGVPHNFAVYTDSSAQQAIFRGQIITGPAMATYTFTAPSQPGTYFFRCDVHFTMMTGQFVVQ